MTEVNNRSELKSALKRGETTFHTTNKTLLYAAALVSKFKEKSAFLSMAATQDVIVIDDATAIAITIAVMTTAIALFALFLGYDIKVNLKTGTITATKKKRRSE